MGRAAAKTSLPRVLQEHECVRLLVGVTSHEGRIPAGTEGVIVHIHGAGEAFEVEFFEPVQTVETVESDKVEPL